MADEKVLKLDADDEKGIVEQFGIWKRIVDQYQAPYIRRAKRWIAAYKMLNTVIDDLNKLSPRLGKMYSDVEQDTAETMYTLFGSKPYYPIYTELPYAKKQAAAIQDNLDWHSKEFGHYKALNGAVRLAHLAGLTWLEPTWNLMPAAKTEKRAVKENGFEVGFEEVTGYCLEEGITLTHVPFWMTGWDPTNDNTGTGRFCYRMRATSMTYLKRAVEAGLFDITPKEFEEKCRKGYGAKGVGDSFRQMMQYMPGSDVKDDDWRMVIDTWSPTDYRRSTLLDGEILLRTRQAKNPNEFYINMIPVVYTQDLDPTNLFGNSDMAALEQHSWLLEFLSGYQLNSLVQQMELVGMYNTDVFADPNMISAGGGTRIPVSGDMMQRYSSEQMFRQLETKPLPADLWRIQQDLRENYNEIKGRAPESRGAESQEKRTAYEIKTRTESGGRRFAGKMRFFEEIGLEMLAWQMSDLAARFQSDKLSKRVLGENARYFRGVNGNHRPEDLRAEFRLKGSLLMSGKEARHNTALADLQVTGSYLPPQIAQEIAIQVWKESEGLSEYAKENIFKKYEEEQKMMQQQPPGMPAGMPGAPGGGGPMVQASQVPDARSAVAAGAGGY